MCAGLFTDRIQRGQTECAPSRMRSFEVFGLILYSNEWESGYLWKPEDIYGSRITMEAGHLWKQDIYEKKDNLLK